MTRPPTAALAPALVVGVLLAYLGWFVWLPSLEEGRYAALPQSADVSQAAPPEAFSASPLASCRALDFVSEADCLNRCLRAETDFVFYHSSNGVLCMVPCDVAVRGPEA